MTDLTSTQAFWLGHLFHASSRQLALSKYAEEQALELASLLAWEQRLVVQGVCPCHLAIGRCASSPWRWPDDPAGDPAARLPVPQADRWIGPVGSGGHGAQPVRGGGLCVRQPPTRQGKLLFWERNGFVVWYKRLERERFKWPDRLEGETVTLSGQELNWLFSHTPSGALVGAAIYCLVETAKAKGLSPYEYLRFVFETLPTLGGDDDLDALLTWRWKDTLPI